MFKLFMFACLMALAAAAPEPKPAVFYNTYGIPVTYSAPYTAAAAAYSPYTYAAYAVPYSTYSAYSYSSPYTALLFR